MLVSNSDPSNVVQVTTVSGVLKTPKELTVESARLIREVVEACGDDPRVNSHVVRNSWTMHESSYDVWLRNMLTCYPPAAEALTFDYRAGVEQVIGLISGIPLTKRRHPEMTDDQIATFVINSFALLRGSERSRSKNFFISVDEITLRDKDLTTILASSSRGSVDRLSAMVEEYGAEPLRAAEVEAALSGDQASALSQGAL